MEARLAREKARRDEVVELEASLIDFVEAAWPSIDPSEYRGCWAIDALCEHLQAVTEGQIPRLLVNFPPRCAKTNVTSICFPAWTWARRKKTFLSGPQVRFLAGSYNDDLALQNAMKHRRLVYSNWYQERWGSRFTIMADQNTKSQFDTSAGGSRLSTSARGSLLGLGGDVVLIDDPHNTKQAESELERLSALNWWKEISTTRLNDPKQSAIVVIMQRLHEEDVSGVILDGEGADEWVHLCIPMRYVWGRHCVTGIGWQDPRGLDDNDEPLVLLEETAPGQVERVARDNKALHILNNEREGELMWPERFGDTEVRKIEAGLGPYMASGRLQQMPVPDKGGIFQRDYWQLWDPPDGKFPPLEYVLGSLDSAFTSKEENDPSGFTIWGVFVHPEIRKRRLVLLHAWRKFLQFSGPRIDRGPNESETAYIRRTQPTWGLMEWVSHTCNRFKVDRLLIEAKASGISAAQELQNRYGTQGWAVQLCPTVGDKLSRALGVQATFAQEMVYAPDRDWAEMVIEEMAVFPKGRYDDLTDSATQAISHLRNVGLAMTDEEVSIAEHENVRHKPQRKAIYPI